MWLRDVVRDLGARPENGSHETDRALKIVTWNVNSIRRRETIVLDWLRTNAPDILLLQETKVDDAAFPRSSFEADGWHLAVHGQPGGRNGVAIIARSPIDRVACGLSGEAGDEQARYIEGRVGGMRVASIYVPNGTRVDSDNFAYKLRYYDRLKAHMQAALETDEPLILGGDYNVAPEPIDVYDPQACEGTVCYHAAERRAFRGVVHCGLYDAFRAVAPTRRQFTWWDLRGGAWERDEGMRIDFLLLSAPALDRLKAANADPNARVGKGVSDHIPVWCELQ